MTSVNKVIADKLHGYAEDMQLVSPMCAGELRQLAYKFVPKPTYLDGKVYKVTRAAEYGNEIDYLMWSSVIDSFLYADGSRVYEEIHKVEEI